MALPRSLPVVAALALALPASAGAANGSVAFDRGGSILTTAPATLSSSGTDFAATVSPDGAKIVYAVNRDLWTMAADGSDKHRLTTDGASNADPDWSPGGKRIAFSAVGAGGRADLFTMPAAGGPATPVTATPDHDESEPDFSPDGTRIAFTRTGCETPYGGGTCVYVAPATGGAAANLTPEDRVAGCDAFPGYYFNGASKSPSWSPDGHIAFSGPLDCAVSTVGSDIWVMDASGAGKVDLTHDDGTVDIEPAFSPDGMQIAFARNLLSGPTNIHVLAGATVTQLTTGGRDRRPDWGVAPTHCVVPNLKHATLTRAKARLKLMGCGVGSVAGKRKTVVAQSPKPHRTLKLGAKVDLRTR